ncbi:hypothetical protein OV079_43435 [Nannocystis pusilla]|uniref:Uncharacterized protein n=1 Tax=Nannocystis pusilla TaxID=889268 RepID=A0A9X3EXZ0_9BACT|nr:hypothetical protein [Nannocystis pusilla]MCY1012277.1 hypothetical protein [Nannocystis pusilla]
MASAKRRSTIAAMHGLREATIDNRRDAIREATIDDRRDARPPRTALEHARLLVSACAPLYFVLGLIQGRSLVVQRRAPLTTTP